MAESLPGDQQAWAGEISVYLRDQADQQTEAAERLAGPAAGTRFEAPAMEQEVGRMRERGENLQRQADQVDRASEAKPWGDANGGGGAWIGL